MENIFILYQLFIQNKVICHNLNLPYLVKMWSNIIIARITLKKRKIAFIIVILYSGDRNGLKTREFKQNYNAF